MRSREKPPTAVEKIRAALVREVHFAVVAAIPTEPSTLRIEGPAGATGAGQRAVEGHEKALFRAGFRVVECLGTDPDDPRGRPARWRAIVPVEGAAWEWEKTSGEALQALVMRGDDTRPRPRPAPTSPPVAPVLSLAAHRAKRR